MSRYQKSIGIDDLKSASTSAGNPPWWWFEGGTEICSTCDQSYAYQTGSYCLDCDCNLCPLCVQESENHDLLCSACCGG